MKILDYFTDRYEREARLFPAIISTFPIFLLLYFYSSSALAKFLNSAAAVVIGDISFSLVFIFLLVKINRFTSREILQRVYFGDEQKFPTTNILLYSDTTFSQDYKKSVHDKIFTDFGIKLLTKRGEKDNEKSARQKINEAVSLIREKVKNGRFVLNENIFYGFWRNLIGGAFIGLILSIFDIVVFTNWMLGKTAIGLAIFSFLFFSILLLFSKFILGRAGKNYAKTLIKEYLLS